MIIMSKNYPNLITGLMTCVILLIATCSYADKPSAVTVEIPKDVNQKDAPAPSKVTVEVKKSEGKDAPEVKVQVEGKSEKETAPAKTPELPAILPLPGEKLSPVETQQIDKAAEKVGKKVEEIEFRLGLKWGSWVWTEAFYGITWFKILAVILAIALVFLVDRITRWLIRRRLRMLQDARRKQRWKELLLEAASRPLSLFIIVYGIYAAISPLFGHFDRPGQGNTFRTTAGWATDLVGSFVILWLLYRLLQAFERLLRRSVREEKGVDDLLVTLLSKSLRIVIVTLGGIFLVQNLTGLELGPLLASLGLGGLAVALAAKDSISNFFGTLTIIFDHPFEVGDHIKLATYEGVVESIGFRSTLIRTFDGALVSIPNEKAVNSGVENVGRRRTIRWHTNIGIRYDTSPDKVTRAVRIISESLYDEENMNADQPPRVFFNGFNQSSLNITIFVWYNRPTEWWSYQEWLQDRCLQIMREFEKEGIEFAFPTQTLFLENNINKPPKSAADR